MNAQSLLLLALACIVCIAEAQVGTKVKLSSSGPFQIDKGFTKTITFSLDEPIICSDPHAYCAVVVLITNPNTKDLSIDTCQVKWTNADWSVPRTITIKATENFKDDGERSYVVVTKPVISASEYYSGHDCPDITIKTQSRPTRTCSATGDPHYTTFDGYYFHEYGPGQMVLYGAPWRNFEIQARVWRRPAVHCGLAAREGNNIVKFNFCPGDRNEVVVDFKDPANQPKVSLSGNLYTVNFVSGAQLQFYIYPYAEAYYFNVYVTAPGMDFGRTVGMCGNFDNNAGNDAPSYVVNDIVGLFPSQQISSDLFAWSPSSTLPTPAPLPYASECAYVAPVVSKPVLSQGDSEDITNILKAIQVQATAKPLSQYDFFDEPTKNVVLDAVDEAKITTACQNAIANSDLGKVCAAVTGINLQGYVDNCIIDLKMMAGDLRFVNDAFNAMQAACAEIAGRDLSTYVLDANGNLIPNPALTAKLCPNGCSGRGTCNNGVCACSAGFAAIDCSHDLNAAPVTATLIPSQCDAQNSRGCPASITVTGSNFYNQSGLTCRFGTVLTAAIFVSPFSVQCVLPSSGAARTAITVQDVAISNNGTLFSTSNTKFTWFDSVCHVCSDATGTCTSNTNACVIAGTCYRQGDSSSSNACKTCQPAVSTSDFTADISNGYSCGPVFVESQVSISILDVTPANTTLKVVNAANSLVDAAVSKIRYSLAPNSNPSVAVNPTTGLVYTVAAIDPKAINVLTFNSHVGIVATDAKNNTATQTLFLSLQGTNRAPVFTSNMYNFTVQENSAIGMKIGSVNASDPNLGQATAVDLKWDVFTYSWILQEVGFGDMFAVNNVTGAITIAKNVDFEQKSSFRLQVRAQDGGGMFNVADVYITVVNVNEAPTNVTVSSVSIAENNAASALVGTLSTVDPEMTDSHTYTLITTGSPFVISGNELRTSASLNYEAVKSYTLVIRSADPGSLFVDASIVISVTDVNEAPSAPSITLLSAVTGVSLASNGLALTMAESVPLMTPFASVTATDPDANQAVSCGVTGSSLFQISGNQILLAASLDFETAASVSFKIACSDNGIPSLTSALTTFTVTVVDSNESGQNVRFTTDVSVPENAAANAVVGVISAVDNDVDATTLTFSTGANSHFQFASAAPVCTPVGTSGAKQCTATLLVKSGLDFETKPIDSCEVITVDNHGLSSKTVVPVKITDVNEAPTGLDLSSNIIMEKAASDTLVGHLLVIDPDQTASTYAATLVDSASGRFKLVKASARRDNSYQAGYDLVVADGSQLSFENKPQETVVISVVDQGTPSFTVSFNVAISVSNRPMVPVFSASQLSQNDQVGRKVASISLDALDRNDLVPIYTVSGADAAYLTIVNDNTTRVASVLLAKSVASVSSLSFNVIVFFKNDLSSPVQKSFVVPVNAVNQPPEFKETYDTVYIRDDTNVGTSALTVVATDPESAPLTYTLVVTPTVGNTLFKINANNGDISTKVVPSSSNIPKTTYTLTVTATDGANSVNKAVSIRVIDDCFAIPGGATPCNFAGTCTDGFKDYTCACDDGFTGADCENIDLGDGNSQAASAATAAATVTAGAVAGIVIGVICALILVVVLVIFLIRKQNKASPQAPRSSAIAAVDADGQKVVFNGGNALYDDPDLQRLPASDFEPGVTNPMYSWYQPHMSRQECEDHLNAQGEGAFILRDSSFTPGWHMLGVKSNNQIVHERIKLHADGTYELLPSSNAHQPAFRAIPELIEHYATAKRPGIAFSLALDNPLYDNHLLRETRTAKPLATIVEADAPAVPTRYNQAVPVPNSNC